MVDSPNARVRYGDHRDQFVEVYEPSAKPNGSILLIHGGYWRDPYVLDLMDSAARHLASRGWSTLNVEYRRLSDSGEPVWSDMSADIVSAAAIASAKPTIAVGHSAGGHLALWVAANSPLVDAVIALAPLTDLRAADRQNLSEGVVRKLLGGSAADVADLYAHASPIELVPLGVPQLVIHGDADDSVPQQMSFDYVAAALEAGDDIRLVALAGVDHMQLIDPSDPSWRSVDAQLDEWATTLRR